MNKPVPFRLRIKELLKQRGESQLQMEMESGVCRSALHRGVKRRSTLTSLAYFFQMPVEELVAGTDAEWVLDQ